MRGVRGLAAFHHHVLGQRQHDRAGTPVHRGVEGMAHHLGDAARIADLGRPFRGVAEHLLDVDLLEGLALARFAGDLADEEDERRRILKGGMDADHGVARAGPARHQADAGPPGHLAVGLGHVAGADLVARSNQADRVARVPQRVEHAKIALAGHAEGEIDAMDLELVDEDLSAGALIGTAGHGVPLLEIRVLSAPFSFA